MLHRILYRFFWNFYDSLGTWMLISLAAFFLSLPIITLPLAMNSLLVCARRADQEKEISLLIFLEQFKIHWGRAWIMGGMILGILILGTGNFLFYGTTTAISLSPILRSGLMTLVFWLTLFAFLGIQLSWGFMAYQDISPMKALKRGFIVTIAHPLTSLTLAILLFIGQSISILSIAGILVLMGALWANGIGAMIGGVLDFYEEREHEAERKRLEAENPKNLARIRELDLREAERLKRYERSWRDIIRPWDLK